MKFEMTSSSPEQAFVDQANFRRIMTAFAYPGKVICMDAPHNEAGSGQAHLIVLDTLLDETTSLFLDSSYSVASEEAIAKGWPIAARSAAAFALCTPSDLGDLSRFAQGSALDPHLSTTLIIEVTSLADGGPLTVSGPGVPPSGRKIFPQGLPEAFSEQWRANNRAFPRGVDLILTAREAFMCLPRSVRLEAADVRSG